MSNNNKLVKDTIEDMLDYFPDNKTKVSICIETTKDTLDSAIPYYTMRSDTLFKYGDARFALGYLKSLVNRLLEGEYKDE